MYADDFYMYETAFSAEKDSISLDEMKAFDKEMWANYDFKMLIEPVLLPGVKRGGTTPDGSVRHYIQWEITKPATDSTEATTGEIKLYESFYSVVSISSSFSFFIWRYLMTNRTPSLANRIIAITVITLRVVMGRD